MSVNKQPNATMLPRMTIVPSCSAAFSFPETPPNKAFSFFPSTVCLRTGDAVAPSTFSGPPNNFPLPTRFIIRIVCFEASSLHVMAMTSPYGSVKPSQTFPTKQNFTCNFTIKTRHHSPGIRHTSSGPYSSEFLDGHLHARK